MPETLCQKMIITVFEVQQPRGSMRWCLGAWRCVWFCRTALKKTRNSSMLSDCTLQTSSLKTQELRALRTGCAHMLLALHRLCCAGVVADFSQRAVARALVQMPCEKSQLCFQHFSHQRGRDQPFNACFFPGFGVCANK